MRLAYWLNLALALTLCGCGANSTSEEEPNNGGKTNWLKSCDEDSECGTLDCIGSLCTRSCDAASDCEDLAGDAFCAEAVGGGSEVCIEGCLRDADCGQEQYCAVADGETLGTCEEKEAGCGEIFSPVCGSDGITYDNDCLAERAGVSVEREGECSEEPCSGTDCEPVVDSCAGKLCGDPCECLEGDPNCPSTDQAKYCDAERRCRGSVTECPAEDCAQRDPETCEEFGCWVYTGVRIGSAAGEALGCMGVGDGCDDILTCSIDPEGNCWTSSSCIPEDFERVGCEDPRCCEPGECEEPEPGQEPSGECTENADCAEGEHCSKEACDAPGKCAPDLPCDTIFAPVCGCDGATYENSCSALQAGAGVQSDGECQGECDGGDGCDCQSTADCAEGFACVMNGCESGICFDERSIDCAGGAGPVCGCDGTTYADVCSAQLIGVRYDGECGTSACAAAEDCAQGQHCYREGCDVPGECRDGEQPICPPDFDAACSCDGTTVDACTARNSGQGVDYVGECADDVAAGSMWRSARVSFGECAGQCTFTFERNLAEPTQVLYQACGFDTSDCARSEVLELNEAGLRLLANAQLQFRGAALEDQYGCPDCADGGATLVVIESTSGMTEHSYEYSNPPPEFEDLDLLLLDLHVSLYDCAPGAYFSYVGECSPPL